MTPLPVGKDLALLGCAWPSLVGLVVGAVGMLTPTFGLWLMVFVLWLVASLPCLVFVFRGVHGFLSSGSSSIAPRVLAAVIGIPIACLGLYLGGVVFVSVSPPARFA